MVEQRSVRVQRKVPPRAIMNYQTFMLVCVAIASATETFETIPSFEEYHYNLPPKETHAHLAQTYVSKPAIPQSVTQEQHSYGRAVAAAAAAQHAHSQLTGHGNALHQSPGLSHYTKPGSASAKSHQLSQYSPTHTQKPTKKQITVAGVKNPIGPGDVESAAGYIHGNYAGTAFGHVGYPVNAGYGYSAGYGPSVAYGGMGHGHVGGYTHTGYVAVPLGGYGFPGGGYGGRGYVGGYGLPFMGAAGLGGYHGAGVLGSHGAYGLGGYGLGGLALGGYGLGGVGLGGYGHGLPHGGYGGYHG